MKDNSWTLDEITKMQNDLYCYESEVNELRSKNKDLQTALERCNKEARAAANLLQKIEEEKCDMIAEYEKKINFLEGQIDAYQYALNCKR